VTQLVAVRGAAPLQIEDSVWPGEDHVCVTLESRAVDVEPRGELDAADRGTGLLHEAPELTSGVHDRPPQRSAIGLMTGQREAFGVASELRIHDCRGGRGGIIGRHGAVPEDLRQDMVRERSIEERRRCCRPHSEPSEQPAPYVQRPGERAAEEPLDARRRFALAQRERPADRDTAHRRWERSRRWSDSARRRGDHKASSWRGRCLADLVP
jgi:hypothetical protein